MRILRIAAAVFSVVVLTGAGCNVDTGQIQKGVEHLGDKVDDAASKIAELKDADLTGLKTLLASNEKLRNDLQAAYAKLSEAGLGTGVFVLKNKRLYLEITDYRGAFAINSYVDDARHWTTQNFEMPDRREQLTNYGFTPTRLDQVASSMAPKSPFMSIPGMSPFDRAACQNVAESAFQSFLARSPIVGGPVATSIALNDQFLTAGDHTIVVTPTLFSPSAAGEEWFIRGQLVAVSPEGTQRDVIKIVDWSNRTTKDPKGLAPASALIRVDTHN